MQNLSLKKKTKKIIRSKHFRSMFSMLLVIGTLIFAISCKVMYSQYTNKLGKNLESNADQIAITLQKTLESTKNNAIFIGNLKSVDTILNVKKPTIDQLSRMISDVTPFLALYKYETIGLYFNRSERIFDAAGGMYYWEDYFNPSFLKQLEEMKTDEMWLIDKPYGRYYGERFPVQVITFVRKLPLYETERKGYVTVSIQMNQIYDLANERVKDINYPAIVYCNDELLWSSSKMVMENWDANKTNIENESTFFPNAIAYKSTTLSDTQCTFFVTNKDLIVPLRGSIYRFIGSYILILLLVTVTSAVYTIFMLRPVDEMMRKIGAQLDGDSMNGTIDEFSIMNKALDQMTSQMKNITTVMSQNKQLMQERLLSGILYNQIDIKDLDSEFAENGIIFPYPNFAVVLIAIPNKSISSEYSYREQVRLVVKNNAAEAFSSLGCAYTLYLGDDGITVLINTERCDTLQGDLLQICTVLRESIKTTFSFCTLFSVCICPPNDQLPARAFLTAKKNVVFTSLETEEFIFFGSQNEEMTPVDDTLIFQCAQCIIDQNVLRLKKIANTFAKDYLKDGISLQEAKHTTTFALCSVFRALLGYDVSLQSSRIINCLKKVETVTSIGECDRIFFECVSVLASEGGKIPEESHHYVRQALEYIEHHFTESITMPQVAGTIGINAIYLNKVFKISTGKTLSEYLNFYRVEHSKVLLKETNLSVIKISEQIGYNDVRSYIRFFKKFHGLTPNEYRHTLS